MADSLQLVRLPPPDTHSPFMELPTEIRIEIYKYLLTVEHGARYATISTAEFRYRAAVRKLRRDNINLPSEQQKRMLLNDSNVSPQAQEGFEALLNYNGDIDPLLHVDILRANHQIYEEAKGIVYEVNTISIKPDFGKQSEPLHYQLFEGLDVSKIRYFRLDMCDNGGYAYEMNNINVQSRSYGIWSSFLHLPALRELKISISLQGDGAKRNEESWNVDTFCAKTVRNIITAVPSHVKLNNAGETGTIGAIESEVELRSATAQELEELYSYFEHIRGLDAEIWKTEMECMLQPPLSPTSKYEAARSAGLDELVTVF